MYDCFSLSFPYRAEMAFLQDAIHEVLPDLPDTARDTLVETLQSLGVETSSDLQFVTEADLLPVLRPIQVRKAVAAWTAKCKYDAVNVTDMNMKLI